MVSTKYPSVQIKEINVATSIPNTGVQTGAIAGVFQWGRANKATFVTSEKQVVAVFGKPDPTNFYDFFSIADYLSYSASAYVVRVLSSAAKNACSDSGKISATATVTAGGTTYGTIPTVVFTGGAGTGAAGTAIITSGAVTGITIINRGTGYTSTPTISFTGGGGSGATATVTVVAPVLIDNRDIYDANFASGQASVGLWAAKYAGEYGNSLTVSIADAATFSTWTYKTSFSKAPATGQVHVIIVDTDGKFENGVAGQVLESYGFLSVAVDAVASDGTSNYYAKVVNDKSNYALWMNHPTGSNWGALTGAVTFTTLTAVITDKLSGGLTGNSTVTSGNYTAGFDKFKDIDSIDINYVLGSAHNSGSGFTDVVYQYIIDNILEIRQDVTGFFSPLKANVVFNNTNAVQAAKDFKDTTVARDSSYAIWTFNWKKRYDPYNNVQVWVPMLADAAGLVARTAIERAPWFAPGGLNRGKIKNAISLSFEPSNGDVGELGDSAINPVILKRGQGFVFWGNYTGTLQKSPFQEIQVRQLFNYIKRSIRKTLEYSLFELNDEFTRMTIKNIVDPFLKTIQGDRGLDSFLTVCDKTNNTPDIVERNQLIFDMYLKSPSYIRNIIVNMIATPKGLSFEEVVGKF